MHEFLLKKNLLNHIGQQQLMDFLDSLLKKPSNTQVHFDLEGYQQKLLKVSSWSEAELDELRKNAKLFNREIEEW